MHGRIFTLTPRSIDDSCHSRYAESTNFIPKILLLPVAKLLQYSGLGSNTVMGFLRTNDLSEDKNGEFGLNFKVVIKTRGWWFAN